MSTALAKNPYTQIELATPEHRMIARYALQGHPVPRIMALTGRPASYIETVLADPEIQHWITVVRMAFEDKMESVSEMLTEAIVDGARVLGEVINDPEARAQDRIKAFAEAADRHPAGRLIKRSKVEQERKQDDSERKNVLKEVMEAAHALKQTGEYKALDDAVDAQFTVKI